MLIFLKLLEYIYKLYREQFVRQLPQVIRTSYWYIVSQHIERSKNCMISKSFFMPNTCTTATWLSVSSFSWLWINSNKKNILRGQLAAETTHFLNQQIVAKFAKIWNKMTRIITRSGPSWIWREKLSVQDKIEWNHSPHQNIIQIQDMKHILMNKFNEIINVGVISDLIGILFIYPIKD